MMLFRSSRLHQPRPALAELYVADPQIFQRMQLPLGISGLMFRTVALHELGELETTFTDADAFKAYIEPWSSSHIAGWNRIKAALDAEYNPIHNYDMTETETPAETTETIRPAETTETETPAETTETRTPAETTVTDTPAEITETRTPAETTVTESPAETTETRTPAETTTNPSPAETTVTDRPPEITDSGISDTGIYGFNSAVDTPAQANTGASETKRKVDTAGTAITTVQTPGEAAVTVDNPETVKTEVDTAGSQATTVQSPETTTRETVAAGREVVTVQTPETVSRDTDTAGTRAVTVDNPETRVLTVQTERILERSGNIGVTTSQQMIEAELELRVRTNLLAVLIADFRREICVGVW